MFVDAPPTSFISQVVADDWYAPVVKNQDWFYCDATRQFIGNFAVGEILYRPTERLVGIFEPPTPSMLGRFSVTGLPMLAGRGKTIDEARTNWELNTDAMIQRLLGVQDFEFTDDDRKNMHYLSQYFDLPEVRYSAPLHVRNYGKLVSVFPRPWKIRWIDGTTCAVSRHQIPAELVRYAVGQEFEAVVEQDSRTGQLVKIHSVFRTQSKHVTDSDVNSLLSKATSSAELPDLEWD